jgi:hypothetical protein
MDDVGFFPSFPFYMHHFWSWMQLEGLLMERCCFYRVGDGGSRRRGVTWSWRPEHDDGCVQGGGATWRRVGIDRRPDKVYADISVLKMGLWEMEAATFVVCT